VRADAIDVGSATALAQLGLARAYVGVDGYTHTELRLLGRDADPDAGVRAVAALRDVGVPTVLNALLVGPTVPFSSVLEEIEGIGRVQGAAVHLLPLEVRAGTALFRSAQRRGLVEGCVLHWAYRFADERTQRFASASLALPTRLAARSVPIALYDLAYHLGVARRLVPEADLTRAQAAFDAITAAFHQDRQRVLRALADAVLRDADLARGAAAGAGARALPALGGRGRAEVGRARAHASRRRARARRLPAGAGRGGALRLASGRMTEPRPSRTDPDAAPAEGRSSGPPTGRPVVVVAGASGFVGQALGPRLARRFATVGLTRSARGPGEGYDAWRPCDLFSLSDAERALEGATHAVYLVHSMLPSARLTQGRFEDLDLICADNFARAARRAGVRQIVYLGGLLPEGAALSAHLESRREVERTLGGHGVPVTTLRAGLILGAGGSSFQILRRLVERLPAMLVPSWTATPSQPIALDDVVALVDHCLGREEVFGETYDVGGPEILTYREMMAQTATALGLRRPMVPVPVLSPRLSRLWVSAVTGAPLALVSPLVQSLAHPMVARDRRLQEAAGIPGATFAEAVARALADERQAVAARTSMPPRAFRPTAAPRRGRGVRSVQRLPLPPGRDAAWVADEYMRWLPSGMRPLRVEVDAARVARFYVVGLGAPLLELSFAPGRSGSDRQLFRITGGLLAARGGRGRLEMREAPDGRTVIAAIHDFEPALPWPIYRYTQALVHVGVMHAFGRHLGRAAAAPGDEPPRRTSGRAEANGPDATRARDEAAPS
jgi:uncharacterized protein YbjT (DUF2867 family)